MLAKVALAGQLQVGPITSSFLGKVGPLHMTTRTSHLVRPLVALVALVAAMAAILIVYGASPTHAAGSYSTT